MPESQTLSNSPAKISPLAGKPATPAMLVNVPRLVTAYYTERPDPAVPAQRVAFGTSGHRGSAFDKAFNEWHILAISQAICLYRESRRRLRPALSRHGHACPFRSGHGERTRSARGQRRRTSCLPEGDEYTPTPVVSHAILTYNRDAPHGLADGIVITPSHNPPHDGGFKYNPPNGGPAETDVTSWIEAKANEFLANNLWVETNALRKALRAATTHRHDYLHAYVNDLANVIDLDAIRGAKIRLGVDPLGGAGVHYWGPIAERYGLDLKVVNEAVDPTFRFMTVDWDGQIRMDPSSPYAMQRLIGLKDRFDIALACDTDHDRHGIVTRSAGLLPPNHYLSVAIFYLFPTPAEVAQGSRRRQDGREQPDDRSRRREAWPQTL